jgi:DNA primase
VDAIFFGAELAMPRIWDTREVYICEGLFDYFPLQRIFPNTICTGTANVSKRQIAFLTRFVDHVNVVFDMDWGGNHFWQRFEGEYKDSFKSLRRIELRGKDVSEVWESIGDDGLNELLTRRLLF